jgi:hypothetical protein
MVVQTAHTTRSCMHASPALSTVQVSGDDAFTRFGNELLSSVTSTGLLDRVLGKDLLEVALRWVC